MTTPIDEVQIPEAPNLRLRDGITVQTQVRPAIMGIVNVTPDSFGTKPLYPNQHPQAALEYAQRLHEEGADIIDIGAESTRPGAERIPDEEQLKRLLPVVKGCVDAGLIVSVDTCSSNVAHEVLEAGAHVINDVSGLADLSVAKVCLEYDAAYVLMHARSTPKDMQSAENLEYPEGIVDAVDGFFRTRVEELLDLGFGEDQIVLDPGFGFAKSVIHNFELIQKTVLFATSGLNVLVGISRKSFIGSATGISDPLDRDTGTTTLSAFLAMMGAQIHRVHNVAQTIQAIRMMRAIDAGEPLDWPEIIRT
ncbi:dihydropteroate synthase [Stomatohabitans albus]|uniref:dihydropteroate synthase n=1 Tax=Stomatohabitans albus TaxID=3110766 RepID=UPI00300C956D